MRLILVIILLNVSTFMFAQSDHPICLQINEQIKSTTQALSTLNKKIIIYPNNNIDSAFRVYYTNNNNKVVYFTLNQYSSNGIFIVQYYFDHEKLIFISESKKLSNQAEQIQKYYFSNNKLIEWIDSEGNKKDKDCIDYLMVKQDGAYFAYNFRDEYYSLADE